MSNNEQEELSSEAIRQKKILSGITDPGVQHAMQEALGSAVNSLQERIEKNQLEHLKPAAGIEPSPELPKIQLENDEDFIPNMEESVKSSLASKAIENIEISNISNALPKENENAREIIEKTKVEIPAIEGLDIDFSKVIENLDEAVVANEKNKRVNEVVDRFINERATYNVVALRSAYQAKMFALNLNERQALRNTSDTVFDYTKKLYKVLFKHIDSMNVPKPSFNDWLKITAYHDKDIIVYGMYAITYPKAIDFDIKCRKCGGNNKIPLGPESIVAVKNEEVFIKVMEILQTIPSYKEILEKSVVGKIKKVLLPRSKIIAELYQPSLADHLNILNSINEKNSDSHTAIGYNLFIKKIFMLDIEKSRELKKASYIQITDMDKIISIISNIPEDDEKFLDAEIEKDHKEYNISYEIGKFNCIHCLEENPPTPLDVEQILFQKVAGRI